MYDNYNYPYGADTPDAPWNQVDPDPVDFDVDVCYVLTKTATISSDNYSGGYRDEEGYYEHPDYEGEAQEDYEEQFLTPLGIMQEYQGICQKELDELNKQQNLTPKQRDRRNHLRYIIQSCEDWEEEFEYV